MSMSKRALGYVIALIMAVIGTVGLSVSTASAHHPVIEGSAVRACGADSSWTATFQARADQVRNKQWRSQYSVDGGTPTPFGAWVSDSTTYGPFTVGPFPASKSAVTIKVSSEWRTVGGRVSGTIVRDNRSITIARPSTTICPPPSSTTSSTTTSTTSTTSTSTTTTVKPTTTTEETTTTLADTTTTAHETTSTEVQTSLPEETTTTQETTTTSGEATTTTAATTTTGEGTTTTLVSTDTAPTPPSEDTVVTPGPDLPYTGDFTNKLIWWGLILGGIGIFLLWTVGPRPRH